MYRFFIGRHITQECDKIGPKNEHVLKSPQIEWDDCIMCVKNCGLHRYKYQLDNVIACFTGKLLSSHV